MLQDRVSDGGDISDFLAAGGRLEDVTDGLVPFSEWSEARPEEVTAFRRSGYGQVMASSTTISLIQPSTLSSFFPSISPVVRLSSLNPPSSVISVRLMD